MRTDDLPPFRMPGADLAEARVRRRMAQRRRGWYQDRRRRAGNRALLIVLLFPVIAIASTFSPWPTPIFIGGLAAAALALLLAARRIEAITSEQFEEDLKRTQ